MEVLLKAAQVDDLLDEITTSSDAEPLNHHQILWKQHLAEYAA